MIEDLIQMSFHSLIGLLNIFCKMINVFDDVRNIEVSSNVFTD